MVPTSWQDEALAHDGVSREVPCSALKGETVPDFYGAAAAAPPSFSTVEITWGGRNTKARALGSHNIRLSFSDSACLGFLSSVSLPSIF